MNKRLFVFLLCLTTTLPLYAQGLLLALGTPGRTSNIHLNPIREAQGLPLPPELAQVTRLLTPRYNQIRASRLVYNWEVASPRDRMPNYCIDQCACLSREFNKVLRDNGYTVRTLTINAGRQAWDVRLHGVNGLSPSYLFHMVSVVRLGTRWWVLDPLVLSRVAPEPLSRWIDRLEARQLYIASVY